MLVTDELLQDFRARSILLGPSGRNPWLKSGDEVVLRHDVALENNVGLYGKKYKAQTGGISSSGLCTIGFMSYSHSALPEGLKVGRYCSIASGLSFLDSYHPTAGLSSSVFMFRPNHPLGKGAPGWDKFKAPQRFADLMRPAPVIGNDVWIGEDVTLSMGIKIGTGAFIGARSVVTKDVPPYALVAGNPARVKKYRFPPETIERLLASRWWDFRYPDFAGMSLHYVPAFLDELDERRERLTPIGPPLILKR